MNTKIYCENIHRWLQDQYDRVRNKGYSKQDLQTVETDLMILWSYLTLKEEDTD